MRRAGWSRSTVSARVAAVDTRPALSADRLRIQLLEQLAPETTVLERAKAGIGAAATTWMRPDPLAPVSTFPRFDEPTYDGLQRVAPWLFLPGIEQLEADGVALLETSPLVIEAYLAGLNHELSRELLWREFPAALSGTAFQHFWEGGGGGHPAAVGVGQGAARQAPARRRPAARAGDPR